MIARATAFVFLAALSACSDATEVVIVVSADEAIAQRASSLVVTVTDGRGGHVATREDPLGDGEREVRFPQQIPLAPRDGDASRRWGITVEAKNPAGCVLARVEAEGGYEDGVSQRRELRLEDAGAGACPPGPGCDACDDGLACTEERCVDAYCVQDVVSGGCAIAGACIAAGETMSGEPCRVCDPERAETEWSLATGCDAVEVGRIGVASAAGDLLGQSIAVSGDRVVAGAPEADPSGLDSAGAAYVIARRPGGSWELEATLVARDATAGDQAGFAVAIDGDTIAIGAPYADAPQTDSGAVFVFARSGSGFSPVQTLSGEDGFDYFGSAVALEGDLLVVGAPYDDPPMEAGAAYVFERAAPERFVPIGRLDPPEPEAQAFFGTSVDVSGARIVVGEPSATVAGSETAGAAHVFERMGESFVYLGELTAATPQAGAAVGTAVAIDGPVAIAGAPRDDVHRSDSGAAYAFGSDGSAATETAALVGADAGGQMTLGLDLSLPYVAAGAPYDDPSGTSAAGIVYLFEQIDAAFVGPTAITASTPAADARLGRSVAIDGRWLAAGAPGEAPGGAVYLFELATR